MCARVPATRPVRQGWAPVDSGTAFVPRAAETDELGMTHVRMDRTQHGVPVLGEQVVGHLDSRGKLSTVTGVASVFPK